MSDALIFALVFIAFVVIRLVAATIFFYIILPDDGRCPNCDTPTIRVQSKGWNLLMPWFRTSWCYNCHWEGLLRKGVVAEDSGARRSTDAHRNVET
jgi:hypothetical protein